MSGVDEQATAGRAAIRHFDTALAFLDHSRNPGMEQFGQAGLDAS
ncbi:hypothetical protein [Mycolicibacterium vinylchloridicum]|nr:hypothetical protein [Mycolicibacterium vinylchloridicum]